MPDVLPMLAGRGMPDSEELHRWAVEPKLDGWRVRVQVEDDRLVVRSRPGRIITECVPELVPLARRGVRVLLDGELIAGAGRMEDFYRLSGRLAGRGPRSAPLVFMAFDLLALNGLQLTSLPDRVRRDVLEELDLPPELVGIVPRYRGTDAVDLLAACEGHGLEGVVVKRLDAPYRPGARSDDWRKVKCAAWMAHAERRMATRR